MSEPYDPAAFPPLAVTVDLVLMTVQGGRLSVLLQRRSEEPHKGKWALPGGFVGVTESLDEAAHRILADKARMTGGWLEQLYSFGDPNRDPRMRVVTIAYFALVPVESLAPALAGHDDLMLAPFDALPDLAFDHPAIVNHAATRLRGKLDYAPVALALLSPLFTLRALQDVHEAILGTKLNKPAFRRRMLDRGWIEGTGVREEGGAFRPAELFRAKP
ncbi:NUDIX hydrolase [Sphingopyxis sp. H115]|uniref:NUDIX hydrolase n=1 Tax=Sphingopyxis sp. H115 TaxID=1759073 RepID=UPI00073765FE|nr:NUDIX domain-containing protein [Sphingopyxis sp. H115]KTE14060.1 NUDIX hydrolase [Sphingopyxis sp. H115]